MPSKIVLGKKASLPPYTKPYLKISFNKADLNIFFSSEILVECVINRFTKKINTMETIIQQKFQ